MPKNFDAIFCIVWETHLIIGYWAGKNFMELSSNFHTTPIVTCANILADIDEKQRGVVRSRP